MVMGLGGREPNMNTSTKLLLAALLLSFPLAIDCGWFGWFDRCDDHCDVDNPANCDFERYYGVDAEWNPFYCRNAEDGLACGSRGYLYMNNIPKAYLLQNVSYINQSPRGNGKTRTKENSIANSHPDELPCFISKSLVTDSLNKFTNSSPVIGKTSPELDNLPELGWDEVQFAHLALIAVVNSYILNGETFRLTTSKRANAVSPLTLIKLGYVLVLYSAPENLQDAKRAANDLLRAVSGRQEPDSIPMGKLVFEADVTSAEKESVEYSHLSSVFQKLRVVGREHENIRMNAAYAIWRSTGISVDPAVFDDPHKLLTQLCHDLVSVVFDKKVVIYLDGMDEVPFFFQHDKIFQKSLDYFIRSALNQKFLALYLDDVFRIRFFFPKRQFDEYASVVRRDKINFFETTWTSAHLEGYLDGALRFMKDKAGPAKCKCKSLPTLRELISWDSAWFTGEKGSAETFNKIKNPRDANAVMREVLNILNSNCANRAKDGKPLFMVTGEEFREAYEKAKENFLQEYLATDSKP